MTKKHVSHTFKSFEVNEYCILYFDCTVKVVNFDFIDHHILLILTSGIDKTRNLNGNFDK